MMTAINGREECKTCKASRWEHSEEQWDYCQRAQEVYQAIHDAAEADEARRRAWRERMKHIADELADKFTVREMNADPESHR